MLVDGDAEGMLVDGEAEGPLLGACEGLRLGRSDEGAAEGAAETAPAQTQTMWLMRLQSWLP